MHSAFWMLLPRLQVINKEPNLFLLHGKVSHPKKLSFLWSCNQSKSLIISETHAFFPSMRKWLRWIVCQSSNQLLHIVSQHTPASSSSSPLTPKLLGICFRQPMSYGSLSLPNLSTLFSGTPIGLAITSSNSSWKIYILLWLELKGLK